MPRFHSKPSFVTLTAGILVLLNVRETREQLPAAIESSTTVLTRSSLTFSEKMVSSGPEIVQGMSGILETNRHDESDQITRANGGDSNFVGVALRARANFLYSKEIVRLGIQCFFDRLRAFVSSSAFEVIRFQAHHESLKNELAGIRRHFKALKPYEKTKSLINMLNYTTRLFQCMDFSAKKLNYYSTQDVPGNRIIYKTIELPVRVLVLCNSSGFPDFANHRISDELAGLDEMLNIWTNELTLAPGVPLDFRRAFRIHYRRAEGTLFSLKSKVLRYKQW